MENNQPKKILGEIKRKEIVVASQLEETLGWFGSIFEILIILGIPVGIATAVFLGVFEIKAVIGTTIIAFFILMIALLFMFIFLGITEDKKCLGTILTLIFFVSIGIAALIFFWIDGGFWMYFNGLQIF